MTSESPPAGGYRDHRVTVHMSGHGRTASEPRPGPGTESDPGIMALNLPVARTLIRVRMQWSLEFKLAAARSQLLWHQHRPTLKLPVTAASSGQGPHDSAVLVAPPDSDSDAGLAYRAVVTVTVAAACQQLACLRAAAKASPWPSRLAAPA